MKRACGSCSSEILGAVTYRRMRAMGGVPEGVKMHQARGLCGACYEAQRRTPVRSSRTWTREELLEEIAFIGGGSSRPALAARLGLSEPTLYRALRRAVLAGDERAIEIEKRLAA